ncbi:MAG: fibronectin type III domain-containing protein [Actinomycetes bacterium]|jgi:hypothetical protein|nr:fibronectin type III domain-containing protein [Actinomycetes bacterium]
MDKRKRRIGKVMSGKAAAVLLVAAVLLCALPVTAGAWMYGQVTIHQGNAAGTITATNITTYYPETGPLVVKIDSFLTSIAANNAELAILNSSGAKIWRDTGNKYFLKGTFKLTGLDTVPVGAYRVQLTWGSLDLGTDGYKDFTIAKKAGSPGGGSPATGGAFTDTSGKKISITVAAIANKTWTGKQIKPKVAVVTAEGTTLKSGTDYTLSYGKNKNIGKATIKVTGKGSYKGSISATFKIVPKKPTSLKLTAAKKSLKVTFKKVSKAQKITSYKVQYRLKGTSAWKSKTVKVKLTGASAKKTTAVVTLKKLTSKKTYQVRVYAYKGAYAGNATGIKTKKIK